MKKLIISILFIIFLSSCDHGFKEQMITEKSTVPISYSDSTKWIKAEVYYQPDFMYVKTGHDVYAVHSNLPFGTWIIMALVSILIGMLIGLKISE